jgi:hypothetical protein
MPTTPPHSHFQRGQTQDRKQELNERPLSTIYEVETLILAHDLAYTLVVTPNLLTDAIAPTPDGALVDYRFHVLTRGERVGLLLANAAGVAGLIEDHFDAVLQHALATRLKSVSPNDIDLVVHVGGYDFALASLRRAEQDRNALPVQPIRWHHFTVAPEATISEESIDD